MNRNVLAATLKSMLKASTACRSCVCVAVGSMFVELCFLPIEHIFPPFIPARANHKGISKFLASPHSGFQRVAASKVVTKRKKDRCQHLVMDAKAANAMKSSS